MGLKNLFIPKWRHPNSSIRRKAVAHLADEDLLSQVAKADIDPQIRTLAIDAIQSQSLLCDIIIESEYNNTKIEAINKILDRDILSELLEQNFPVEVHQAIWSRLADINIAFRMRQISTISDEELLVDIVENDTHPGVCQIALSKIQNQENLRKIALGSGPTKIKLEAIQRLNCKKTLKQLSHISNELVIAEAAALQLEKLRM